MFVKQVPGVLLYSVVVIGAVLLLWGAFHNDGRGGILHMSGCEEVVFKDYSTGPEEASLMFEKINQFRVSNGKSRLNFSNEAYRLAKFRAKDLVDYEYYAHTNPVTGDCSEDIKDRFDISNHVSETLFGQDIDNLSPCASWEDGDTQDVLDAWFTKENSRNNLLHDANSEGAVNCFWDKCVFIGINSDGYGNKCIANGNAG